ncbi:MAG: hypothetical protein RLP44_13745 [Aggregatilineales bacterium]
MGVPDSNIEPTTPDNPDTHLDIEKHSTSRRWGGMFGIILLATILVIAGVIGFQLLGILYGLIFPPDAPLPDDATEISHENLAYGSDRWVYGTDTDGCALVEFYVANDGLCVVAPGACIDGEFQFMNPNQQTIATCEGEKEFSIFALRWSVTIGTGYATAPTTRFNMEQDVLWFGASSQSDDPE